MRIIYLYQYFVTPTMPGGTRGYEFGRRLAARGHEVHMITADQRPEPGPPETDEAGITVHWLPVEYSQEMGFRRRLKSFFSYAIRSTILSCRLGGDVIVATSTPLTVAIPGLIAKRWLSAPMVFEVRDLWPDVPIALGILTNPAMKAAARSLEGAAYKGASRIISLSPENSKTIAETGIDPGKVVTIPNSCDRAAFAPSPEDGLELRSRYEWLGDRPLVVYTGTMGVINNLSYLAHTAAAMSKIDGDVRFLIVGGGSETKKVTTLAAELGILNKSWFMAPPVPKEEVKQYLAAADFAVSTVLDNKALWPNSANKVFDALASETPVAVNHGGWIANLLEDSGAGIELPAQSPDAAAQLMLDRLNDPDWLDRAQQAAAGLAEGELSRDGLFERFHQAILEATNPPPGEDLADP